jgi:hypothetical protein
VTPLVRGEYPPPQEGQKLGYSIKKPLAIDDIDSIMGA